MASESVTVIPWSKVVAVSLENRTLHVQRRDRQTSTDFVLQLTDALRAEYVAQQLLETSSTARSVLPASTLAPQQCTAGMIGDEITNSTPATPSSVEALSDTVGT